MNLAARLRGGLPAGITSTSLAMLVAALFALGFLFRAMDGASSNPIVAICVALVVPFAAIRCTLKDWEWAALAAGCLPLLAYLLWAGLSGSGVFGNIVVAPDLVTGALLSSAAALFAFVIGVLLGGESHTRSRFVSTFAIVGGVVIAIGLFARLAPSLTADLIEFAVRRRRFSGTIGNANVAAYMFGTIAVFALVGALKQSESRSMAANAWLFWPLVLGGLGATILTASRTGAVMTIAAILAITLRHGWRPSRALYRRLLSVALILGMVSVVLAFSYSDELSARAAIVRHEASLRWAMYAHYLGIARDAGLAGVGPGSFAIVNGQNLVDAAVAQQLWMVNSAHNLPLRIVIETGFVGLVISAVASAVLLHGVVATIGRGNFGLDRQAIAASLAMCGAFALVDVGFDYTLVQSFAMFQVGLLWRPVAGT